MKDRLQPEDTRRHADRIRELKALAERLGCNLTQLAIAWCLKNESVQCLLLGASSVDQLYESIQSLQVDKNFYDYKILTDGYISLFLLAHSKT